MTLEERVAQRIKAANVGEYMSDNAATLCARAAIDEVLEAIAAHLERQPSFGDGKWAARHVRSMKGDA